MLWNLSTLISGNLNVLKHFKPKLSNFVFNIGPNSPQKYAYNFFNFVVRKFIEIFVHLEKLWAWLLRTWDFSIEYYVDHCVHRIS